MIGMNDRELFNETFSIIPFSVNLVVPLEEQLRHNFKLLIQSSKYVIKTHIYELDALVKYNLLEDFRNIDHYRIMLLRRNIFESALSLSIAKIKDQWTNHVNTDTIIVPVQNFIESFWFQWNMMRALVINELAYDEVIYYEELTFCPRTDFYNTKLCDQDIDALPEVHIVDNLYKAPNKKQTVENYDDLYTCCLGLLSQQTCDFGKFEATVLSV
jgi:hypothetical protein